MAEAYELQYKKVHNTLEKPAGDSVYGNQVGQRVNNLLAPKITTETLGTYNTRKHLPTGVYYITQVTNESPDNFTYFINKDFYKPETEYILDTSSGDYIAQPSYLARYKKGWYHSTVAQALDTYAPLTANFQDIQVNDALVARANSSLVAGQYFHQAPPKGSNDKALDQYSMVCSSKILIDLNKNYMFQLASSVNSLPDKWKIGFQLMCENIAEAKLDNKQNYLNAKHYTQAYTTFDDTAVFENWDGKPISINLNTLFTSQSQKDNFTNPLKYTYIDNKDKLTGWAPWQHARYQYLIVYIFIPTEEEISLIENYQFFLYEGSEVAILDTQGTILGFTGERPLSLQVSTAAEAQTTWTLQSSGIFTDKNFKPTFTIQNNDLVLNVSMIETMSDNTVTFSEILQYLKDTKKELVAVPYIDYQDYDSASKQIKNRTRKTVYRNTGTSTNSSAANWIRYVNVVRSAKDTNHFYQTTQKILVGDKEKYCFYTCNPDVHFGVYRFNYFINPTSTNLWSITFSHDSNKNNLPKDKNANGTNITEIKDGYNLNCLSFSNSVFQVAQPTEYTRNSAAVYVTLPKDVEKLAAISEKYHFTPKYELPNNTIIGGDITPPNIPTPPNIWFHDEARAPRKAHIDLGTSTLPGLNGSLGDKYFPTKGEDTSACAYAKQDKHLYLRPIQAGGALPGLQVLGNCREHKLTPNEQTEISTALSQVQDIDPKLNIPNITWVKIFFQWEVWEWGSKTKLNDPIIGDRFGLWARDDVVFKKETDVNITHSPYVYIAKACSGATSPSVDELVKFYFEWQEIKFAPTAEGNIIAFPTAWIKKA